MSLFILVRHAQSTLNLEERVNGDPKVHVELTEEGVQQARRLQLQVAQLPIDLCVHTRFERTRQTAAIVLEGRAVPLREESLLDDIDVGVLEGRTYAEYRAWKQAHSRRDPFPGGESLDQTAARYARAFASLARNGAGVVLVVCHEIPLRYALNATAGSESLEAPVHGVPNATPFLFETGAIKRAAQCNRAAGAHVERAWLRLWLSGPVSRRGRDYVSHAPTAGWCARKNAWRCSHSSLLSHVTNATPARWPLISARSEMRRVIRVRPRTRQASRQLWR